jgi:hypothetical protein
MTAESKAIEENEAVFYGAEDFDESAKKFSVKLAPGQRFVDLGPPEFLAHGHASVGFLSARLGNGVGIVIRDHNGYSSKFYLGPWYRPYVKSVADVMEIGDHFGADSIVVYRKTDGGSFPDVGALFSNFSPVATIGSNLHRHDLFVVPGETDRRQKDGGSRTDWIKDANMRWLAIFGLDTEVRLQFMIDGKPESKTYTKEVLDQEMALHELPKGLVDRLVGYVVTSRSSSDSGGGHLTKVNGPDSVQAISPPPIAAGNYARDVSGQWQGTPGPVTFAQNGNEVSGIVVLEKDQVGVLAGTLTGDQLDFYWFVGANDLTFGRLIFAADGKTAKGYYQDVSGGPKADWELKR